MAKKDQRSEVKASVSRLKSCPSAPHCLWLRIVGGLWASLRVINHLDHSPFSTSASNAATPEVASALHLHAKNSHLLAFYDTIPSSKKNLRQSLRLAGSPSSILDILELCKTSPCDAAPAGNSECIGRGCPLTVSIACDNDHAQAIPWMRHRAR
jgi:hypothetical protein